MTSMKKRISAALTAATLTIVLTIPAMAAEAPDETVRVSSYKGSFLEVTAYSVPLGPMMRPLRSPTSRKLPL